MPLSEDEERILQEIAQRFYEDDPSFAREVSETTLYRHTVRRMKWSVVGLVDGMRIGPDVAPLWRTHPGVWAVDSRRAFAAGAVRAAEWLPGRSGLFSFEDMVAEW